MTDKTPLARTLRQADAYIQIGKNQQAIKLLAQVLKVLPKHPQAHSRMGGLYMQTGQAAQAIRHFEIACEMQPKVLHHWLRLLSAYQEVGDLTRAKAVLEQAAQHQWPTQVMEQLAATILQPPGQRQHHLLAMFQSGKDAITTEIAAHLFIDDYPEHPLGWQILGALLNRSGRLEEALEVERNTVERFPDDANAHNNLAHTQLALKRYAEALVSARAALKLNPGLVQAKSHEQLALAGLKEAQNPPQPPQ